MWSPWRIEAYSFYQRGTVQLFFLPLPSAYTTTGTSYPSPVVEFPAELGDQVGRVFGVLRLDQMVIVVGRCDSFLGGAHGCNNQYASVHGHERQQGGAESGRMDSLQVCDKLVSRGKRCAKKISVTEMSDKMD